MRYRTKRKSESPYKYKVEALLKKWQFFKLLIFWASEFALFTVTETGCLIVQTTAFRSIPRSGAGRSNTHQNPVQCVARASQAAKNMGHSPQNIDVSRYKNISIREIGHTITLHYKCAFNARKLVRRQRRGGC